MTATINKYFEIAFLLEHNRTYLNTVPYCEPMLAKRNLHASLTTNTGNEEDDMRAIKWLLNLADGKHDLIRIAERSGIHYRILLDNVPVLLQHELLKPIENSK